MVVNFELFHACKLNSFMPKTSNVRIVVNSKPQAKDSSLFCTVLVACSVIGTIKLALYVIGQ